MYQLFQLSSEESMQKEKEQSCGKVQICRRRPPHRELDRSASEENFHVTVCEDPSTEKASCSLSGSEDQGQEYHSSLSL